MFKVKLAQIIDPPWLRMKPLRVGRVPPTLPGADFYILVFKEDDPFLRVDLFDSTSLMIDPEITWNHFAIAGHFLAIVHDTGFAIVDLEEQNICSTFDSYQNWGTYQGDGFAILYSIGEVVRINNSGKVAWRQDLCGEGQVLSIGEKYMGLEIATFKLDSHNVDYFHISLETGERI